MSSKRCRRISSTTPRRPPGACPIQNLAPLTDPARGLGQSPLPTLPPERFVRRQGPLAESSWSSDPVKRSDNRGIAPRAMSRTKPFDPEEALTRAMELFRERGFEASSMEDLVDRTGVHRPGLCQHFGGRQGLLAAALRHYGDTVLDQQLHELERSDDGIHAVRSFLDRVIEGSLPPARRGCLVLNHAVELTDHDAEVERAVRHGLQRQRMALRHALRRAVARGELCAETDVSASAEFLLATARGLTALGRAGAGPSRLRRTALVALDALEGEPA